MKRNTYFGMIYFLIGYFSLFVFIGCEHADEEALHEVELAAYSFGPLLDPEVYEVPLIEYNGVEVRIPYYVEGHGRGINSDFSWFSFVDGLPQVTRLETHDGEIIRDASYMHRFSLAFQEREEFYVVFNPSSGRVGESVGFVGATILQPDFMPNDILEPYFGIFHALTATLPSEIRINRNVLSSFEIFRDVQFEELSASVLTQIEDFLVSENVEGVLEDWPLMGLFPNEEALSLTYDGIIESDSGVAQLNLFVLGGREVTHRITMFVNHQPVRVNAADFIELEMQSNRIAVIPLELQLENLEAYNSVYAIMMTNGADYHEQEIYKTRTLLLVEK